MKTTKIGLQDKIVLFNSAFGIISSVVSILSMYATRIILSHILGEEIYGLNTLFASIMSALLIVELGISSAMVIFMYQPIAQNDSERVKTILLLYKRIYTVICLVIFFLGAAIDLFLLKFFVNSTIPLTKIRLFFLLYLLSAIAKYVWSYKRCVLFASNKNRISSIISSIVDITFMAIEILCILVLKSYWAYLCAYIVHNLGANVICSLYVNKHYPFVKEKECVAPTKEDRKRVVTIVKPLFVQRLANQIQDSSATIIYSALGNSVVLVGFFSNYVLVIHAIQTLFNQIAMAITSSLGCSFVVDNDLRIMYLSYLKNRHFMIAVSTFFTGCYVCFVNYFIRFFFGEDYLLSRNIVYLTALYLLLLLSNEINKSVQNALGEHRIDSLYMVLQTIVSILLSVVIGYFCGLPGVLYGIIASFLVFSNINKGRMVYSRIFLKKSSGFFLLLVPELILSVALVLSFHFLFSRVRLESLLSFILASLIALVVMLVSTSLLYSLLYKLNKKRVVK